MKTAVIIHGSMGNPDRHWYQWLKEELEKRGLAVTVPQFPIEEGEQTVANWLKVLEPMKEKMAGSIIVGHSLGAPFIVDLLNEWDIKMKGAFFVGGFVGHLESNEPNVSDFSERDYNWEKIKNSCEHFVVLNSDDDPYVPLEKGRMLAEKLGIEVTVVPKAGHFQSQSGYETFPLLLQKIEEIM